MNEQLQMELTKIITNINKGTESVWEIVNKQTPDIINQLLWWYGIWNFMLFIISISLLVIVPFCFYKLSLKIIKIEKSKAEENDKSDSPACMFYTGFMIISGVLSLVFICNYINLTWLKIWLAPKVWLLDYIISYVK